MRKLLFIALLLHVSFGLSAQFSISGTVRSSSGESLPGASIALKGSYKAVATDAMGHYSLSNIKAGKYILTASFVGFAASELSIDLKADATLDFQLTKSDVLTDEVTVSATRAGLKTPVAYSTIGKEELQMQNMGQDVPFLLNMMPSVVVSSDAGTGVGYTAMRIRGTDQTRINVTVNGIPLNDPESHGVYWVDLPDFASSTENIQIQRGVGTSSNGAGAFGGTVNLQTSAINKDAYATYESSAGSFGTFKNAVKAGTGLLSNGITSDFRYSRVKSDGFIDRGSSDLESLYGSIAYYKAKGMVRLNVFSGHEKTYQAWNGIPKFKLENNKQAMDNYISNNYLDDEDANNLRNSGSRTYNSSLYRNEVDDYTQQHYQLLYSYELSKNLTFDGAMHYTKGFGYYENYKKDKSLTDFGMSNIELSPGVFIKKTDLIRRKWLDNDFFGTTLSLHYKKGIMDANFGGAWNKYVGDHYGRVVWAQYSSVKDNDFQYYFNKGKKTDYNAFAKINVDILSNLSAFADIQYRNIAFEVKGNENLVMDVSKNFQFVNPKFGLFLSLNNGSSLYSSFSIANREPNRNNYTDAIGYFEPKSERLYDFELGYNLKTDWLIAGVNLYNMNYKDQLVQTGNINDVGDGIMVNVPKSYRRGVELTTSIKFGDFRWDANCTYSKNKIADFKESLAIYDENWAISGYQVNSLGETDIAMSPNWIFSSNLNYGYHGFSVSLMSKYIGKQFVDNTSSSERMLDAYFLHNLLFNYSLKTKHIKEIGFNLLINNLFNVEYISNAWAARSYSPDYQGGHFLSLYDGYFPQAGRNYMAGVILKF